MIPKDVLDQLPEETRRVFEEAMRLVPRDTIPAPDLLETLLERASEVALAPSPVSVARLTVAAVAYIAEVFAEKRDEEAARAGVVGGVAAYAASKMAGIRGKCAKCGQTWDPITQYHAVTLGGEHVILGLQP